MASLIDTTSAVRTAASAAALNIAKPAGATTGMWMIAILFDDRSSSGAWTAPAGWEQIYNRWTDDSDCTIAVFIRKIDGTEGAGPYGFTPPGSITCGGWVQLWDGLDPLFPIVNFLTNPSSGVGGAGADIPAMVAPFDGCAAVALTGWQNSNCYPVAISGTGWSTAGTLLAGIGDTAGGAGAYAVKTGLDAGDSSEIMHAAGAVVGKYQSIVLMLAPDWTTGGVSEAASPIEFVGSVADYIDNSDETHELTPDFSALPYEVGDQLVAICWVSDDSPTWIPPAGAGWIERGNGGATSGNDRRLTVFTKPVEASEDTTPTFTYESFVGDFYATVAIEVWRGLDPVTPIESVDTVFDTGSIAVWWHHSAIDVLTAGAAIWQCFGSWTTPGHTFTPPLYFTQRSNFVADPAFLEAAIGSASRIIPNPINDYRTHRWAASVSNDRLLFQMVMRPGLVEPEGLTATELSCSEILVEWDAMPGATGYRIERSDDGVSGWVEVGDVSTTDFTDTDLASDTEYFYRVEAYSGSSGSGFGAPVSAITDPLLPPTVIATATSCFEISLDWDEADCATGYKVERSPDGTTGWIVLAADTPDTDYIDSGLLPGSTWHYRVSTLKDPDEESVPSLVDSDTTDALVAPTGLTLSIVNCSTIRVEWDAVPCADSYVLEGSLTGDPGTWVTIFTGAETEFEIGGRDCDTEYFFQVTAHADIGPTDSTPSAIESITTPLPLAPTGVLAEAPDCFEVHVSWSFAACANRYKIERSLDGSTGWTEVGDVTGNTFEDTDIECETTYYYRVTSYCDDAAGGTSSTASVLTPEPTPAVSVVANCAEGGYVIEVNIPATYDDPISVQRRDLETGNAAPVRGLQNLAPGTYTRIVDYEAPLDHVVIYDFNAGTPPAVTAVTSVTPVPLRTVCGDDTMYLRWLFDPSNMTGAFCLGTIEEQQYQPRAGIFPVISRADPVVVVDEQETARGSLRFIAQTTDEVKALRKVLTRSAQPTLLNLPSVYMLGLDGVLYFQPLSVKEQWLNQDGRIPQHAFDVDYIEISAPPMAGVLEKSGVRFGLRDGGIAGGVTYPDGGWIDWDTDPQDGVPHGDPDDRWTSYGDLESSGKDYGEALFDTP